MEDYKKGFLLFIGIVVIALIVLILSTKEKTVEKTIDNNVEQELHIEQIYFKNIQLLDELPIDQSLLIQDEIMYFFIDKKEKVTEVELINGSLEKLGDYKYKFKVKYKDGTLGIFIDKDKVSIE